MKKSVSILVGLVLLLVLFVGCSAQEDDVVLDKIRVIYHPTIGGSTVVAVADELGYFEEENLDVSLQMFTSGPPEIAAIAAGQAEFGFIGSGAAWLAFSGNVDIIALDNLPKTEEVIVRKDSGITSIKDLQGKVVAVQDGAAGFTMLTVALKENGMTTEDIEILNIANDNIPATYADEKIDCWAGWKPSMNSLKTSLGDNYLVLATNETYPQYSFPSTWVANKEYIKDNPEITQRFVNALTKAMDWRASNPQEACAYASSKAGQATNDLTAQLTDVIFPSKADLTEYYTTPTFKNMLANLRETQVSKVTGNLSIEDIYVDTFAVESVK